MNDQQILEFIAAKQPVRAVQLADRFDIDLKAASDALRALVDVGDLTRAAGTSPNGQPAQVYGLSEVFVKSKEGKLLAARIEAASAADPLPALAATVAPPALPPPAAAPPAGDTSSSRIDLAIRHVKDKGPSSDADIRQVLGLRAGQYPSGMLQRAVKDGRLIKDGRNWTLGTGTPPAPEQKRPPFGGSLGLAGATPRPAPLPAPLEVPAACAVESAPAAAAPPAAIAAEPAAPLPAFRCGLWSDGMLELQRNGVQVAQLSREEGEAVAAFMARIAEQLQAA